MTERPMIALIGRPNVGKSTLFNRLIGRREAITNYEAGTTRDRHFGVMQWFGHTWTLVDTAGILFAETEHDLENKKLQQAMEEQVYYAIQEADLIGLVVDVKEGLKPLDRRIMELLRKHSKPVVLFVNKADNAVSRMEAEAFHEIGVDRLYPVSAIHGTGMSNFIDYLLETFPSPASPTEEKMPHVAVIGRPNVGKSTLLNQILGEKRMIVSPVPGTTRDSVESEVTLPSGEQFVLVDTAGIRRRGKIELGVEQFSLFRTLRAINRSDIVVLLLTIEQKPTRGDAHVAMYALEANKKVILLLNKADLAKDNIFHLTTQKKLNLANRFLKRFPFLQKLPIYFISGETGAGIDDFLKDLTKKIKASPNKKESKDKEQAG